MKIKVALSWVWTQILEQRDRWILWTPVPVAAGIALYFSLHAEPPLAAGPAALVLLCLAILPFRGNRAAVYLWLPFFLFALGFAAAQVRAFDVAAPVLYKKTWPAALIEGRVAEVEPLVKSYRVTLDRLAFTPEAQHPMPTKVRVKLKGNDPAVPRAGDIVRVKAILQPLSKPTAPGAFDFQRHAWFQGLGATGYALSNLETVSPGQSLLFFGHLRDIIRARVNAAGIADKDNAGLILAFLIGDSHAISKQDWETARVSGIAHLIAISGSHFVMIVGFFFFALRAGLAAVPSLALRWPIKKIAAVAGMAAAIFYMFLIGAPVPAQRAAAMSCVVMLAIILDRDPLTLRLAAFAAIAVMLIAPESLMGASFQLSFAAVVGLIAFFEAGKEKWRALYREQTLSRKAAVFVAACFLTTVVAQAATGPFVLYHFLRVPFFAGIVSNMVAVPMSSFITFPAGLAACLLMPFGLEKGPLWLMDKSIDVIMKTAEGVARWPHMVIQTDAWSAGWLVAVALGGLWLCLWAGRLRWLGLAPIALGLLGALFLQGPRPDILIGGHFKLLAAVRDGKGTLWLSPGRDDAFTRDAWTEREGGQGTDTWPDPGKVDDILNCTPRACTYTMKGKSVVFIRQTDFAKAPPENQLDVAAAIADCRSADIVVLPAAKAPKDCAGTALVIDKWDIYDKGVHAVYLKEGQPPLIVTVADERGNRPWTGIKYK